MKNFIFITGFSCFSISCSNKQKSFNYLIEEDFKTSAAFINFKDATRPDIFTTKEGSDLIGQGFRLTVQHSQSKYSGYIITQPQQRVKFVGDRTGDGLPDVLILDSKERWTITWTIENNEPKASIKRAKVDEVEVEIRE